ncbi:MAG: hypothetical protein JW715_03515 [Sedimentisphaerales bacterium]|nr:hypothetical protein [Sedimentisphaerales bacterium]
MKRSGTSTTFVLVCAAVLLASYGIGLGIREIRFRNARTKIATSPTNNQPAQPQRQTPASDYTNADGRQEGAEGTFNRRGRFDNMNMSEDEMSQFGRDRFSRRSQRDFEGFENLSEEERAAMREQMGMRGRRGGRGSRGSRGGMQDFGGDRGFDFGGNDFQPGNDNYGMGEENYGTTDNENVQVEENNGPGDNENGPGDNENGPGNDENGPGDNDL